MKILFYDMGSYTASDFIYHLEKAGHSCKTIHYRFSDKFKDDFFCERFNKYIKSENYDTVFSVNFFPLVANVCHDLHIPYISWSYDSPLSSDLLDYFAYDTNYIFLFDQIEVTQYRNMGYERVFHLPLATNTHRYDKLSFTALQKETYQADISFVGRLYDSPLNELLYTADDNTRGYIEGILQAQLRVYGYYFIEELLTDELLNRINISFQKLGNHTSLLNKRGLSYSIASQITSLERRFILEQMGELFHTKVYTTENYNFSTPVQLCGPVKYFSEMPYVFRFSKLNLNPTIRSIQSGIPLRALDIMGCQGVLLSNYQPELAQTFIDGTDVIMYSSIEELFDKVAFYLQQEELLKEIATNGYLKVKEYFNYPQRIQEIMTHITS